MIGPDASLGPESTSERGSVDEAAEPAGGDIPTDAGLRWKYTEELFFRALECPAAERQQKLIEWCGEDVALRESVLDLLTADCSVEELISTAAPSEPGDFLDREKNGDSEETDTDRWIGQVLGAFRIEKLLGRGGMGVVYLAERISGGFSQKAAVKLVGRHLRSSPAVAQFLVERQTLAKLEHVNIARLLDGGVTGKGFPYVVMEYVEGRRLDEACDDPATTIDQILRWMLQLCDAVGYVHRNLILHRDLKPGNVMVTGDGQVKLLDFGTLKRIGPESAADSAMTQAGMRPVTIRYASPEHIEGMQVSTATDVYSLGMILYRLIAGRLPEGLDDLPIGVYLERLREGRFKPPSQLAAESTAARTMDPQVAKDLDAIVSRAIRCEADARYPTTNALAEDIWSVLLHRPVSARDGSLRYRAAKFYRRYRWPIRAAAAAVFVLTAGLGAMAWQGHIAHLQELRAEKGVEDERQLAHMLLSGYFETLNLIPGSIDAQRRAVAQALGYLDRLAQIAPGSDLEVDTIRGFTDMGDLLGDPYTQNLGNVPEGIATLNKAVALGNARVSKRPDDLETMLLLIKADEALGGTYLGNGDAVNAEKILKPAADTAAAMARHPHATPQMLERVASTVDLLGDVYDPGRGFVTADLDKAIEYYSLSAHYDDLCNEANPQLGFCGTAIVVSEYKFGSLVEDTDPAQAASHYRHGLDVVRHFSPELSKSTRSHRFLNYMLARLGLMEMRTGPMTDGILLAHQAQAGFRELIAKAELDNRARFDLVAFETDLSTEYDRYGKEKEAKETAQDVLGILGVLLHRSPNNLRWKMIDAEDWMTLARAENKLGEKSEAQEAGERGIAEAVQLAQNKNASPQALQVAADGLIEFHSAKKPDAALALGFAQRAAGAYARPAPPLLLTLAKAQAVAGEREQASQSAKAVLTGLAGPIKSKIVADEIAEAHQLVKR
ncbi:MAG TPA: serine/threonine-protein kinase [Acidobacteriaceae bacterium]|nr:serine/threonine-protein kinase [Acidobacteriaceae bacterium]